MTQRALKKHLYDILSGKIKNGNGATIQAAAGYLRASQKASGTVEKTKLLKRQEEKSLIFYAKQNNHWITSIDISKYVSEGAEQRVYLQDNKLVIKLNDAVYYESWIDYFNNLLLHNYFFADTSYRLIGFTEINTVFYAVVEQVFVSMTGTTNLNDVKTFLESNGFINTRNNDYYNPELGIILEDLHDENVLFRNGIYHFIDTVFYTTETFWNLS